MIPRSITAAALVLLAAPSLGAQSLRGRLTGLFVFAPWSVPLQVGGPSLSGTTPTVVANNAFMSAASQASQTVDQFLATWVGASIGNVPVGSTSGGAIYRFERGIPVRTPVSPGPVYGERAQTLGRGALLAGINQTSARYTTVRGVPLNDLRFTFASQNDASSECTAREGRSCAPLGIPASENDLVDLRLDVGLRVDVTSFYATYGLMPRVDVGIVAPVVHTRLTGRSDAQVIPFGVRADGGVSTFISGTSRAPVLQSTQSSTGDATGLGDVSARVKVRVYDRENVAAGVLADVRFPTGDAENLLGSGSLAVRTLGIVSARMGSFSPHASAGYLYWREAGHNDAVLGTVGFDQQVSSAVTIAASVLGEFQAGRSSYQLPQPVTITQPFVRTIVPSNIPNIRDDAVSASLGTKLSLGRTRLIGNVLSPLRRGGPRPDFAYTLGIEQDF